MQIESIEKVTSLLSGSACPDSYEAAFLDSAAPTETCDSGNDHRNLFQKLLRLGK